MLSKMADKQLEFDFMKNTISKVTSLGYIGGQDDGDLGGYCEPLIIEYFDGMEQYVLHSMGQSREIYWGSNVRVTHKCKVVNNHKKIVFPSKLKLLQAWGWVKKHLTTNKEWAWEKTDSICGCDATIEEFYRTKSEKLEEVAA